jgi:hypothetical protein
MIMGHEKLANHFKTNFSLIQHHKWSLSEIEAMMPWERYVYIELLQEFLREEEQKARDRENELKAKIQSANRKRM